MEDDKIPGSHWKRCQKWQSMLSSRGIVNIIGFWLLVAMIGSVSRSDGALCPAVCRCEEEALTTSCANAALEFVPIQLNPEVKNIDLSNNKISNLHFTFTFYDKLVQLDLSSNKISTLGSANFEYQRALKHLNLSSNEIEKLSKDSLKGLKALKVLDISYNRLEKLTSIAFRELHSLLILKLRGNRLMHFEDGLFKSTKHLEELWVEDNQFLVVPSSALSDVQTLRHLSLSRNLIESIAEGEMAQLSQLSTLQLDGNVISDINPKALAPLLSLDHLDISDNNFTALPTNSISKLSNLTTLRFSGNFINNIPSLAFRGLFHLKYVKLDRLQNLETIDPRAFVDNVHLEKVIMDFNIAMEKLPTRLFHGNPKLKCVSVRYNKLESLEVTHFPLDQLRELKVGGNPLQCNCSLSWLWQLIKIQKSKSKSAKLGNNTVNSMEEQAEQEHHHDLMLDVADIRCNGPEDMKDHLLSEASKYQMDCSVGWMAAVSVAVTVLFILAVIGGVVYWAPNRKSKSNKKKGQINKNGDLSTLDTMLRRPPSCPMNGMMVEPYEVTRIEKSSLGIMPPAILHPNEYRSLPPWDPYGAGHCQSTMNIYETLDENTKPRPHIVYV
ncbi:unnamed protein product [Brassicogethes aeneus]|uniref:Uncharacterized protein n=1 Tax=Brassicogethes aeneus TaxID=1431903 RepID=A0A9P0BFI9_BRAAE|nr:unnamed protein product [Brassicogethes aeneus]